MKLKEQEEILTEQITDKIIENMENENQKLMDHIAATREEEKKKSFWSKIFGK